MADKQFYQPFFFVFLCLSIFALITFVESIHVRDIINTCRFQHEFLHKREMNPDSTASSWIPLYYRDLLSFAFVRSMVALSFAHLCFNAYAYVQELFQRIPNDPAPAPSSINPEITQRRVGTISTAITSASSPITRTRVPMGVFLSIAAAVLSGIAITGFVPVYTIVVYLREVTGDHECSDRANGVSGHCFYAVWHLAWLCYAHALQRRLAMRRCRLEGCRDGVEMKVIRPTLPGIAGIIFATQFIFTYWYGYHTIRQMIFGCVVGIPITLAVIACVDQVRVNLLRKMVYKEYYQRIDK